MGFVAEVQTRVQSGGSMADEVIGLIYGRNLLPGSANVKCAQGRLNRTTMGVLEESKTMTGARGDSGWKMEDLRLITWYWRLDSNQ